MFLFFSTIPYYFGTLHKWRILCDKCVKVSYFTPSLSCFHDPHTKSQYRANFQLSLSFMLYNVFRDSNMLDSKCFSRKVTTLNGKLTLPVLPDILFPKAGLYAIQGGVLGSPPVASPLLSPPSWFNDVMKMTVCAGGAGPAARAHERTPNKAESNNIYSPITHIWQEILANVLQNGHTDVHSANKLDFDIHNTEENVHFQVKVQIQL